MSDVEILCKGSRQILRERDELRERVKELEQFKAIVISTVNDQNKTNGNKVAYLDYLIDPEKALGL